MTDSLNEALHQVVVAALVARQLGLHVRLGLIVLLVARSEVRHCNRVTIALELTVRAEDACLAHTDLFTERNHRERHCHAVLELHVDHLIVCFSEPVPSVL